MPESKQTPSRFSSVSQLIIKDGILDFSMKCRCLWRWGVLRSKLSGIRHSIWSMGSNETTVGIGPCIGWIIPIQKSSWRKGFGNYQINQARWRKLSLNLQHCKPPVNLQGILSSVRFYNLIFGCGCTQRGRRRFREAFESNLQVVTHNRMTLTIPPECSQYDRKRVIRLEAPSQGVYS